MKAKPLYYGFIVILAVLLLSFLGVAYGTNKILGNQAAQLSKLRADSQVLDSQQATLAKNKKDISTYSQLNEIAETIVPQDKDQAEAVREIVNLADQSGITKLSSITFPSSTLGTIGTTTTNPNLTQLTIVSGIKGVYELPITITQDSTEPISYTRFTTFLSKLEQNRRTAQVSSITVQPTEGNEVSFTLVINEFIKP